MKSILAVLFVVFFGWPLRASDPPPLARPVAKAILEFMDWHEVTVVSIRQGVDAKGLAAPIYATVIGFGTLQGRHQPICQTMIFDSELTWHVMELDEKSARVWNQNGFREIRPWSTW